jgi:hypothetical protein
MGSGGEPILIVVDGQPARPFECRPEGIDSLPIERVEFEPKVIRSRPFLPVEPKAEVPRQFSNLSQ